ncbi:hypothetical protein PtB15_13B514 [Puccinia triticina]|nr:hypothetical protein PtB15_13B514 [Puccinia triticina]
MQHLRKLMGKELGLREPGTEVEAVLSESARLVQKSVLDAMKAQADLFKPESAEVSKVAPTIDLLANDTWAKIKKKSNGVDPHQACLYLISFPTEVKPNIKTLFKRLDFKFDHAADLQDSPIPSSGLLELLIRFDRELGYHKKSPQIKRQSGFLHDRLHVWFNEKYMKIIQTKEN